MVNIKTISLVKIFLSEKFVIFFGALLSSFAAAFIYIGGFDVTILSKIPVAYSGDLHFTEMVVSWMRDGSFIEAGRSGYPFIGGIGDYPTADGLCNLFLKIVVSVTGSVPIAINLFFFISFGLIFATTYIVFIAFGVSRPIALVSGVAYAFASFHFYRIHHIYFSWYFLTPLVVWVGFVLYQHPIKQWERSRIFSYLLLAFISSSCGVYYAAFYCILWATAGFLGWIRNKTAKSFLLSCSLCIAIAIGVGANILPFKLYQFENGTNAEVAVRSRAEAEIYGLKLVQMIVPHPDSQISIQRKIADRYNKNAFNLNENQTASINTVGIAGLFIVIVSLCYLIAGQQIGAVYSYSASIMLSLFIWATVGGFSSLFSYYITPLLRGWNRISIILMLICMLPFFVFLSEIFKRKECFKSYYFNIAFCGFAFVFIFIDQIPKGAIGSIHSVTNVFDSDKSLISNIEKSLPSHSPIYQLPYQAFPENPHIHNMPDYAQAIGVIQSKTLRWSYGVTKGRPGAYFFENLSKKDIATQINVIKKLGFKGILINRNGYDDHGRSIEQAIRKNIANPSIIESELGDKVFYSIPTAAEAVNLTDKNAKEIFNFLGFYADKFGERSDASIEKRYMFNSKYIPFYIKDLQGVDKQEDWGRWSIAKSIRIELDKTVPEKFLLKLEGIAFGPNIGKTTYISVDGKAYYYRLDDSWNVTIPCYKKNENLIVEIHVPIPISPIDLGVGSDGRKLGLGLVSMQLETEEKV